MGDFKPRKYQSEGIQIGIDFLTSPAKNPSLMVFPCAAGKSHIIAEIVRGLEEPTLVVVPSQELLAQNYEKFVHAGGIASLYSASVNSKVISKVTFATIGSLKGKAAEFKAYGVRNIIVDEAHFSIPPAKDSVFSTFIRELGVPRILGLTATPFLLKGGLEGSSLSMLTRIRPKLFKDILYVSQISEMVENNWWSPLEYELHPFDVSQLDLNTTGANYTEASIKLALDTQGVNNRIYKRILQLQEEGAKSILVFVDSVESAELFTSKIPNSTYVHGGTNKAERLKAVEDFKGGQTQVMFNYGTFTTGFDYPDLSHVILGRPSNSFSLVYQMCFDRQTEVLTTAGFKKWDEISINDTAFGFDLTTSEIKENKIKSIVSREQYDFEKIMSMENNRFDFRASSEHDMVFMTQRSKNWRKGTLKEMSEMRSLLRLPVSGFQKAKGVSLTPDELMFLGWFLSDGSRNDRTKSITISQSSISPSIDSIRELLKNINFSFKEYIIKRVDEKYAVGINFVIPYDSKEGSKIGWAYLDKFLNKDIADALEDITREQLKIVLEGIIKGDGCNKGDYDWNVATHLIAMGKNQLYVDRLQSLLVRRGFYTKYITASYTNTDPNFGTVGAIREHMLLSFKDTLYCTVAGLGCKDGIVGTKKPYKRARIEIEDTSNEKLWCVDTEMGTVITRRNGKVYITGNCGRVVRIAPEKFQGTIIDFCGNIENFGRLEDMTIEDYPNYGWGVFSGDRLLTGYSLKGPKIYKKNLVPKKELPKGEGGNYTINIGKFKGQPLSKVKRSYLEYMVFTSGFDFSRGPMKEFYEKTKKYLESTKMQYVK